VVLVSSEVCFSFSSTEIALRGRYICRREAYILRRTIPSPWRRRRPGNVRRLLPSKLPRDHAATTGGRTWMAAVADQNLWTDDRPDWELRSASLAELVSKRCYLLCKGCHKPSTLPRVSRGLEVSHRACKTSPTRKIM